MKILLFIAFFVFWIFILVEPTLASGKRIEVNLTNQQLTAFNGDSLIYSFPISSGRWAPTPIGSFKPWAKLISTTMIGGSKQLGTYYNLPNVPYVVYFYQGYAIHGAYWHNNFGYPMSHGCINVAVENARLLYNFIDFDTPVNIYGVTPLS